MNGQNSEKIPKYAWGTVAARHFPALHEEMVKLLGSGRVTDNTTIRNYLGNRDYSIPETLPDTKTLIILAIYNPVARIRFQYKGKEHEFMLPGHYYEDGTTDDALKRIVEQDILDGSGHGFVPANKYVHHKQAAVHSGLGVYGKNNICYVGNMGTSHSLQAFFTTKEFPDNGPGELRSLPNCSNCTICLSKCPTGAIREKEFVIDAGRCIPLFNEVAGTFPDWLPVKSHNALMGCLACQINCPANRASTADIRRLEDVTEMETTAIVEGKAEQRILDSLAQKLHGFYPGTAAEHFPVFTRNLTSLLRTSNG